MCERHIRSWTDFYLDIQNKLQIKFNQRDTYSKHNNSYQFSVNNVKNNPIVQEMQFLINGLLICKSNRYYSSWKVKGGYNANPKVNVGSPSSILLHFSQLIIGNSVTDYFTCSLNLLINHSGNIIMLSGEQALITSTFKFYYFFEKCICLVYYLVR